MFQAELTSKDDKFFGFRHDPAKCVELLNSTAEPSIQKTDRGHLATKAELKEYEGYLKFPNAYMERYYLLYEQFKSSPINKEKYEEYIAKMSELHRLITAAEENIEEWFNWITKAENERFIKVNIEYRLSQDMSNKQLWMLYIQYLKENNPKEMLQIYSKYCRNFPADVEMVKKYWSATRLHGQVYVKFDKLFDFEKRFAEEDSAANILQRIQMMPRIGATGFSNAKLDCYFTPENAQNQEFNFKSPLMRYLLSNASATVLSKLHRSCKYFFIKKPLLPCYRFVLNNPSPGPPAFLEPPDTGKFEYSENSMQYCSVIVRQMYEKNLIISTSLYANNIKPNMLSTLINEKFYQCDAKYIEIKNQRLTEKELNFLVGHGNVELCCLENVLLVGNDGKRMATEDICIKLPMLKYFSCGWMPVTNETIEKLQLLSFTNKILYWQFYGLTHINIIPQTLCDFVVKNATPFSTFEFNFTENVGNVDVCNFGSNIRTLILQQWNLTEQKPKMIVKRNSPHYFPALLEL